LGQENEESVGDVMATRLVMVEKDETVRDAVSLMIRRNTSCLIVVSSKIALGIVTESDLVRKVLSVDVSTSKVLVGDVMSTPLITISPRARISDAAEKMAEYQITKLVVVNEGGSPVGLIAASDLARIEAQKRNYTDMTLNAIARMKKSGTGGPYG
jgi:CBS domain-containing protein